MVHSLEERGAKGEGRSRSLLLALGSSLLALLFAGCRQLPPGPTATPPATFTPVATITPVPPTATPVPLAARVNG